MQPQPQWVKVSVEVDAEQIDLPVALLWAAGAGGVEVQDGTTLAEGREPLGIDRARALAYFGGESPEALEARLRSDAAAWGLTLGSLRAEVFTDETWKERWKQFFKPAIVSERLAVRPPWEAFDTPEGVETLVIEPGLAFGTGTHATTRLCLAWLDDLLAQDPDMETMLDVGCGSGILSMGAARLAPELRLEALDVDPEAVRVCRENLAINGVEARIKLLAPLISEVDGSYDLVVANILAHILIRLGDDLCRCTAPSGRLLLSGIGEEALASVVEAFGARGMVEVGRRSSSGWVALLLQHGGGEGKG